MSWQGWELQISYEDSVSWFSMQRQNFISLTVLLCSGVGRGNLLYAHWLWHGARQTGLGLKSDFVAPGPGSLLVCARRGQNMKTHMVLRCQTPSSASLPVTSDKALARWRLPSD